MAGKFFRVIGHILACALAAVVLVAASVSGPAAAASIARVGARGAHDRNPVARGAFGACRGGEEMVYMQGVY